MDKPKEILDLEKELGFELTETKNEEDILEWEKYKIYFLSEKREVIGLNLNNCELSDISPLKLLVNLTYLSIGGNQVFDISLLNELVNLTKLNLYDNQVSDISPLKQLVNLTELTLIDNQVSDISPLKQLVNLTKLNLWDNQVSDISPLKQLVNLTKLNLWDNQVSDISHLKQLVSLTELNLMLNQVSDISSLKQLVNLNELDLSSNKVSDISPLKELVNLTELNLYGNQVSDILPLKELINLTELNLYDNQVSDILPLSSLLNLIKLNLRDNKIFDASPLSNLSKLTELNLYGNQVSDISPLSNLLSLSNLNLSGNHISDIKPLCKLLDLLYLYLSYNQISDILPLTSLLKLTELNLYDNKISELSLKFINSFSELKALFLYQNPIQNIPKDIFNNEFDNVLKPVKDYLEGVEKAKQVNNEVKVILIGNGSVGKTQVAKRLEQGEKFEFNKNHDSTHAISLLKKNIECEFLEEGLNLTIWDFGGQDIYHSTHRLFMKTRAVFLLVWDIENEVNDFHTLKNSEGKKIPFKNEELNYWLSYTSYFGKNSPILVVQNKIDKFDEIKEIAPPYDEIAQNELKKQFPITEFIQVSAENGEGFEILENSIAEVFEDNEELKRELLLPLPASWVAVRDRVRQEQQNPNGKKRISFQNFVEWCEEEDAENEADTLANFFHDTGVFYYQAKYFSDEIIINQSWAIEAVYKVLDKANSYYGLLKQKKGILDYKIIKKVWSENSDEERKLFIDYMLSTELCFKNTDNKKWDTTFIERSFLIPQLLPSKSKEEVLEYVKSFELKPSKPKEYSFLPTSIIQRFMIKAKDFSSVELMWQTGLFVEYKKSKVIVEAVYEKNNHHILIYHNSAAKNDLLEVILEELDKLDDENSSRNLDRNKLHLGEKSLQKGFEKLQKHKKESQLNPTQMKNKKFIALLNDAISSEIPDLLFVIMENYEKMPSSKRGTFNQLKNEFESPPNNFQLNGWKARLKVFISGLDFEIDYPKQKTTETMAHGIEKEIEGLEEVINLLADKVKMFTLAMHKAIDEEHKLSYKIRLKEEEEELEIYRQKIQKLKGENPNNSELKDLDTKTQKAQEDISEGLKSNPKTTTSLSSVSLLYIAAQPADKGSLRSEFDDIVKKLDNSVKNKEVKICLPSWETDYNDLLMSLRNHKPTILHYSGHGDKNGLALMNKITGLTQELENDELEEIFEDRNEYLKLVFLNSCFSSHQAKIISTFGMYVLGINDQEVADELAIKLAECFYLGISAQDAPISIEKAIKIGCRNFVKSYNQKDYISLWKDGKEINYTSL